MEEKQTIMALGAGATTKFVLKNYLERVDEMIQRKLTKMEELQWH